MCIMDKLYSIHFCIHINYLRNSIHCEPEQTATRNNGNGGNYLMPGNYAIVYMDTELIHPQINSDLSKVETR